MLSYDERIVYQRLFPSVLHHWFPHIRKNTLLKMANDLRMALVTKNLGYGSYKMCLDGNSKLTFFIERSKLIPQKNLETYFFFTKLKLKFLYFLDKKLC